MLHETIVLGPIKLHAKPNIMYEPIGYYVILIAAVLPTTNKPITKK